MDSLGGASVRAVTVSIGIEILKVKFNTPRNIGQITKGYFVKMGVGVIIIF